MDGQVITTIVTGIIGFASVIWKSVHDQRIAQQRHDNDRQDRLDAAAEAKSERDDEARAVRDRLEAATRQIDIKTTAATEKVVAVLQDTERHRTSTLETHAQLSQEALDHQTEAIRQAIEAARDHVVNRADLAFTEANDVNTKIEKLHKMQLHQAAILTQLLSPVSPPQNGTTT